MTTETIDKLYLEWSQFTKARNHREIDAAKTIKRLLELFANDMMRKQEHEQKDAYRAAWQDAVRLEVELRGTK